MRCALSLTFWHFVDARQNRKRLSANGRGSSRRHRGARWVGTTVSLWLAGATIPHIAQAQTTNIDTAQPFYLGSQVGISVNPVFQGGTLRLDQATATYPHNFTLDASTTNTLDQYGNTSTFSGVFSDAVQGTPGNLTISNSGTGGAVTFTNAQTYTGTTTVAAGATLNLADRSALSPALGGFTVNGTLNFTGIYGVAAFASLSGTGQVNLLSPTASSLALGNGIGTFSGSINGSDGLSVAGTQTLSGVNSYTGDTDVALGGTLNLAGGGSIASSDDVTVRGTLDISGTLAGVTISQLNGTGTITLGSQTLTVSNGGEFSGTVSGAGGLSVTGGTFQLSGNNTYGGGTTVSNATLAVNNDAALGATSGGLTLDQATLQVSSDLSMSRDIALSGSTVMNTYAHAVTLAGAISGSGTFTVMGHGSVTLSAANPFAGEIIVDSSSYNGTYAEPSVTTLNLSGGGNLAGASVVLQQTAGSTNSIFDISATNNGASIASLAGNGLVNLGSRPLTIDNAATSFAGVVQGTGGITIAGGSQTLTGSNTYSGLTTIAPGATLALSGAGGISASTGIVDDGTLDFSSSGTNLDYGYSPSVTTISGSGSLILGFGLSVTNASGTFSGTVGAPGIVTPGPITSGVNLFDLAGKYVNTYGTGIIDTSPVDALPLEGALTIAGGNEILTGAFNAGSLSVSHGASVVMGSTATLNALYGLGVDGSFDASAVSHSMTAATLVGSGVVTLGAGSLTINNAGHDVYVQIPANTNFDTLGAICSCFTAAIPTYETVLTYDVFSGEIGGPGELAITGGMQALTGANGYQGGTAVTNAFLGINSDAALGAASGGLTLTNATLVALQPLTSQRSVVIMGVAGIDTNQFGVTFAGAISGTGALSVTGGGTLTLSGANTFGGGIQITGATLAVASDNALGAGAGGLTLSDGTLSALASFTSARAVTLSGTNTLATGDQAVTLTGIISGSGGLTVSGGGSLTLDAPNTFTGPTAIAATTTLRLAGSGSIATSSGLLDDGTFDASAAPQSIAIASLSGTGNVLLGSAPLTITNASGQFSGSISGSGRLIVAGGTQTVTGSNTYAGGTTVQNATLVISTDAALGAPSGGVLLDGGTLRTLANLTTARPFATTATGGTIDTNGFTVDLTGPLALVGPLDAVGSGTLSFGGSNGGGGTISQLVGELTVDSSFDATSLTIGNSAMLRGTGTINAPTTVYGTLAPGHSPGTLTFTAPLTLEPGSTTELDIDGTGTGTGAGSYSRILVVGAGNTVTLGGTLLPLLRGITGSATNSYTPPLGQQFQIIVAQGGIAGSFADFAQPAGLAPGTRFDTVYGLNTLTLVVTPVAYGNLALAGLTETANEASLGSVLDTIRPVAGIRPEPAAASLFDPLYLVPAAAIPSALAQLAPTVYADSLMAGRETWYRMADAVAGQIAMRRNPQCATLPHQAGCTDAGNTASAPGPHGATVWSSGLGEVAQVSGGDTPGYHLSIGGAMTGIDMPILPDAVAGFAIGGSNLQTTADNGATANGTAVQFALYGSLQRGPLFLDAQAAYLHADQDARRDLSIWSAGARGSESINGGGVQLHAGTPLEFKRWQVEPTIGLSVASFTGSALNESSGGAFASQVSGQSITSVQSFGGLRFGTALHMTPSVPLYLHGTVGWTHEFADLDAHTQASLNLTGTDLFEVASAPISRDAARVGFSVDAPIAPAVSVYAAYAASISGAATGQDLTGGIRVRW